MFLCLVFDIINVNLFLFLLFGPVRNLTLFSFFPPLHIANVLALALTTSKLTFFTIPSETVGPISLLHFLISSAISLLISPPVDIIKALNWPEWVAGAFLFSLTLPSQERKRLRTQVATGVEGGLAVNELACIAIVEGVDLEVIIHGMRRHLLLPLGHFASALREPRLKGDYRTFNALQTTVDDS